MQLFCLHPLSGLGEQMIAKYITNTVREVASRKFVFYTIEKNQQQQSVSVFLQQTYCISEEQILASTQSCLVYFVERVAPLETVHSPYRSGRRDVIRNVEFTLLNTSNKTTSVSFNFCLEEYFYRDSVMNGNVLRSEDCKSVLFRTLQYINSKLYKICCIVTGIQHNGIQQDHTVVCGNCAAADDRFHRRGRQPDRHLYTQLRAVQENVWRLL